MKQESRDFEGSRGFFVERRRSFEVVALTPAIWENAVWMWPADAGVEKRVLEVPEGGNCHSEGAKATEESVANFSEFQN